MTTNVNFKAGELIFREGDEATALYVICTGKVRLTRNHAVLADLGRNAFFGEMSLIDNRLRSATAIALEPTECAVISEEDFNKRLHNLDPVLQGIFRVLVERIRKLNGKLTQSDSESY